MAEVLNLPIHPYTPFYPKVFNISIVFDTIVILAITTAYIQNEAFFLFSLTVDPLALGLKILFNFWDYLVVKIIPEGVVSFENVFLVDLLLGQLGKLFVVKLAHVFF